ncbi:MAG: hypothetical protein AMXMBFR82_16710 [Candidatus Hydrogenedentota bacterium]
MACSATPKYPQLLSRLQPDMVDWRSPFAYGDGQMGLVAIEKESDSCHELDVAPVTVACGRAHLGADGTAR